MRTQSVARKKRTRRTRLYAIIGAGAVVAIVVLAILIDAAVYYNKVHAGVSVSGHSISGMTRDEAVAELNTMVAEAQATPITLTHENQTWDVYPEDVGAEIDVDGAVSAAMDVSRESNFIVDLGRRLKLYFSGTDLPLVGAVDDTKIDEVLGDVAEDVDILPVNAGLAIDSGAIKVVEGQPGLVLDQDTVHAQLKEMLLSLHATELPLTMIVAEPAVQADDTQAAVDQAETMIGSSVVLKDGENSWTLTPQQIRIYMDFTSMDKNDVSTLVPYLSAEKMAPFFAEIADKIAKEPKDATFDSDGTKAWVVPGVMGEALDAEKTAEALTEASLKTSGRVAEAAVTTTEPELTTEEAEAMGIKDRLSSYSTEYVGSSNRQVNVRITAEYASNVFMAPGEEYNFDKQIGPRTAARGYLTAPGIVGPGKLEDVFGGGICQVSTTLFNAVFFAGLEVTERKNHSIYIDHYPKGRDATVSAGGPNLRFKNDMSTYIWIRATSNGIVTTFNIYGTDEGRDVKYTTSDFYNYVGRSEVTIPNPALGPGTSVVKIGGQSGKQCKVVRTVTLPDGTVVHKNTFISTYPMIPRQIEVGTGTTTTSTTVPGSSTTATTGATTSTTQGTTTSTGPPSTSF